MKLFLSHASPYARLVRALLIETGLVSRTELVFVDPWKHSPDLLASTPAGKVPALVVDEGLTLIESSCIAEHLLLFSRRYDMQATTPWRLRVLGLGRALMDCAFGAVIQQRFADGGDLKRRWIGRIPETVEALEALEGGERDSVDLADLTVAVALEYLDFRLPETDWRDRAPGLAARMEYWGRRLSMVETRPG